MMNFLEIFFIFKIQKINFNSSNVTKVVNTSTLIRKLSAQVKIGYSTTISINYVANIVSDSIVAHARI